MSRQVLSNIRDTGPGAVTVDREEMQTVCYPEHTPSSSLHCLFTLPITMAGTHSTTSISPAEVHFPDLLLVSYLGISSTGERKVLKTWFLSNTPMLQISAGGGQLKSILMDKCITSALH